MQESIISLKKTARGAGLFYLLMILTGLFAVVYLPMNIVMNDNPVGTFQNIQSRQLLIRLGIVANLASSILSIMMALAFYKLFKRSNEGLAKMMLILILVQVPIVFVSEALNAASLLIAKGELMRSATIAARQDLSVSFFMTYMYATHIMGILMGLWLIILGELFYRSAYMNQVIGILLIFSGVALTIDSLSYIMFPDLRRVTSVIAYMLSAVAEISAIAWLLIKGVKDHIYVPVILETENRYDYGIRESEKSSSQPLTTFHQ